MDLDSIINSDEQKSECRKANKLELIKKLKAQSDEETHARLDKFLKEVSAIAEFALNRLSELAQEYEEFSALGDFGAILAITMQGKPLAYAACGSKKAIGNTMQFAMLKTMANDYKEDAAQDGSGSDEEDEGEDD